MKTLLLILACAGGVSTTAMASDDASVGVEVLFPGAESLEAGETVSIYAYNEDTDTYTIYTRGNTPAGPFYVTPANLYSSTRKVPVVGTRVTLLSSLKLVLQNAMKLRKRM